MSHRTPRVFDFRAAAAILFFNCEFLRERFLESLAEDVPPSLAHMTRRGTDHERQSPQMIEDDDFRFSEPVALRDGTQATIRLMRPDDKDKLIAAFAKLDRQTIYTRFFSYLKALPEGPLSRIGQIDLVRLAAVVVSVGAGANEVIVGTATYVADTAPDGVRTAEVAFTIEEDYQRQGLAARLLAALAGIARRHAIQRFEAEVLEVNAPMLTVFKRGGLPMTQHREGGVIHITLDLLQTPR